MTTTATEPDTVERVAQEILRRQRFVIASHIRPDGDAIGSQLALAYALTRLMTGLLFEVSATDPLTFVVIALLPLIVSLVASFVPALRALKVDPVVALRYE